MKVVVDASNVAHHVKNDNGQPQIANILAAVKALEESEDEFVIIADASLRHEIDDKAQFGKLLQSENVEEVPPGNDADHFILDIATREKARILSNDKFRDYAAEFRNISSMRIPFVIENGRLTFGRPKKPKRDKNILQHIAAAVKYRSNMTVSSAYQPSTGYVMAGLIPARLHEVRFQALPCQ